MLSLRDPSRDTVLYPAVAYPTYEMGALLAGLRAVPVPVDDEWHLDLDARRSRRRRARAPALAQRPEQPDRCGGDARRGWLDAVGWARERGIVVASDECYAEFTYDADGAPAAPVTALDAGADGVLVVHSLSKRSNMAGLRAGFVAGDRDARRLPRRDAQARRADDAGADPGRGGRRAGRRRARPRAAGPLRAPARGGAARARVTRARARRRAVHLLPVVARRRPRATTAGPSPRSSPRPASWSRPATSTAPRAPTTCGWRSPSPTSRYSSCANGPRCNFPLSAPSAPGRSGHGSLRYASAYRGCSPLA